MKTVQQILEGKTHKILSVSPDESVYDALQLMAGKDVGALVVLNKDQLVGIFSERDYARKVVLHGKASKDTLVREVMTGKVLCVNPLQTMDECMALMTDKRVRHLPVIEQNKVVGVISIGDVVKEVIADQQFQIHQLEQYIHM
ncbi:MAG: CBS domain-containing protein [Burkholderiales bacterium]